MEHQRLIRRVVEFTAIGLMMKRSLRASFATPKAPHRKARQEEAAGSKSRDPMLSHLRRKAANSAFVAWIVPGGCAGRRPAICSTRGSA